MIADNLAAVRERIAAAAKATGRTEQDIRLVAATKGVDPDRIGEAVSLGIEDLGENHVQDLRDKQAALGGIQVRWHMIGTLQRNKVAGVVGSVQLIHSVDSTKLAEAIARRAREAGLIQDVLMEVNVSGEPAKHGVALDAAVAAARGMLDMEGIRLRGLMTIPPAGDPSAARAAFRALADLRDGLSGIAPDAIELSMGMSDDFDVAIEEGATIIRVGTAIFGARAGDGAGKATKRT